MVQFFIALFGGLYLLWSYIKEKMCDAEIERESEAYTRTLDEVCDYELRNEIADKLLSSSETTRRETVAPIADDMEEIFGDNWWNLLFYDSLHIKSLALLYYPFNVAVHILMSMQGKTANFSTYSLAAPEGSDEYRIQLLTAQKMEKNMQKFHPEFELVFIPGVKSYTPKEVYSDRLCDGELKWSYAAKNYKKIARRLW